MNAGAVDLGGGAFRLGGIQVMALEVMSLDYYFL